MTIYRKRSETIEAMQLTSTNLAEVVAFSGGVVQPDGSLAIMLYEELVPVPIGYYVRKARSGYPSPPQDFEDAWVSNDGGSLAVAFGSSGVSGTIAAGAVKDIPVSLSRTMPSDTYQAAPAITAGSTTLLGAVAIQGVISRTKQSVTVQVKNTGLTALVSPAITVAVIAVEAAA